MVDFHSHILPNMDDGADSTDCSINMLDIFSKQGVDTVVATPHFYEEHETVAEFLKRRDIAYYNLNSQIKNSGIKCPEIVLGAEVALTPDIAKNADLEKLCIGKSNTILLELPYSNFSEWMTYSIYEIISRWGLKPVLAHFERFCFDKKMLKQFESLLSLELSVQINADSVLDRRLYKIVKHLAKNNLIDVLGSDAHNTDSRKSNFDLATEKITRKFGKQYIITLDCNARKLIDKY